MIKNIINNLLVLGVLICFASCRPKKAIVVPPQAADVPVKTDQSGSETISLLQSKQLRFNTLSLKAKATLDIAGEVNDVTMNFRVKDKEVIWVSVTALGGAYEAARALITPDSIKVFNRLKSQYISKPFRFIHTFTSKQVTFATLQAILTGNVMEDYLNPSSSIKQENGLWLLSGTRQDVDYRFLFNTLLKASEINLNDTRNGQALKVNYSDYQNLNESLFPGAIQINTLSGANKINIQLQFVKIDGNVPVEFPFKVPKSFTLVN